MPRDMRCRCDWKQGQSITTTRTPAAPIRRQAIHESHERESAATQQGQRRMTK
jgi:hypothetical protein